MDEQAEREFREYVASRQAVLFRAALLLTGHRQDAEDLLQAALSRLALHWGNVAGSADAYVRKILDHQQALASARARVHGRRAARTSGRPGPGRPGEDPTGDRPLLAGSTFRGETAVVSVYADGRGIVVKNDAPFIDLDLMRTIATHPDLLALAG